VWSRSVGAFTAAEQIKPLPYGSLRNPVVEKVVNEVLRLVKEIMLKHGQIDEVRVELARELRATKDQRQEAADAIAAAGKDHDKIRKFLQEGRSEEMIGKRGEEKKPTYTSRKIELPPRNDLIRYKLWRETGRISIYTGRPISSTVLFERNAYEIEHITPKARVFDDSFSNKTLAESAINKAKENRTAYEFIEEFGGTTIGGHRVLTWDEYEALVKKIFKGGKRTKLLRKTMPYGFIARQLQETRCITKVVKNELGKIVGYRKTGARGIEKNLPNVVVTTGSITDYLRNLWGTDEILKRLHRGRWQAMGKIHRHTDMHGKEHEKYEDFPKRVDHRNHALDALIVACTSRSVINQLNRINARGEGTLGAVARLAIDRKVGKRENRVPRSRDFAKPWKTFTEDARTAIEGIIVSFNSRKRLLTRKTVKYPNGHQQTTYAVRQELHEDTIYGKIIQYSARTDKKTGKKERIPEEVGVIRKALGPDFKNVSDIIDCKVRKLVQAHFDKHGSNPKIAFKPETLENDPIWFNEANGIEIKKVRVLSRASDGLQPLMGKDQHGNRVLRGYVNPGNNFVYAPYGKAFPTPKDTARGLFKGVPISAFDAVQTATQRGSAAIVPPAQGAASIHPHPQRVCGAIRQPPRCNRLGQPRRPQKTPLGRKEAHGRGNLFCKAPFSGY